MVFTAWGQVKRAYHWICRRLGSARYSDGEIKQMRAVHRCYQSSPPEEAAPSAASLPETLRMNVHFDRATTTLTPQDLRPGQTSTHLGSGPFNTQAHELLRIVERYQHQRAQRHHRGPFNQPDVLLLATFKQECIVPLSTARAHTRLRTQLLEHADVLRRLLADGVFPTPGRSSGPNMPYTLWQCVDRLEQVAIPAVERALAAQSATDTLAELIDHARVLLRQGLDAGAYLARDVDTVPGSATARPGTKLPPLAVEAWYQRALSAPAMRAVLGPPCADAVNTSTPHGLPSSTPSTPSSSSLLASPTPDRLSDVSQNAFLTPQGTLQPHGINWAPPRRRFRRPAPTGVLPALTPAVPDLLAWYGWLEEWAKIIQLLADVKRLGDVGGAAWLYGHLRTPVLEIMDSMLRWQRQIAPVLTRLDERMQQELARQYKTGNVHRVWAIHAFVAHSAFKRIHREWQRTQPLIRQLTDRARNGWQRHDQRTADHQLRETQQATHAFVRAFHNKLRRPRRASPAAPRMLAERWAQHGVLGPRALSSDRSRLMATRTDRAVECLVAANGEHAPNASGTHHAHRLSKAPTQIPSRKGKERMDERSEHWRDLEHRLDLQLRESHALLAELAQGQQDTPVQRASLVSSRTACRA